MQIKKQISSDSANFTLSGKFTFSDHQHFRSIISAIKDDSITSVDINMSDVDFIDSAGLGMLLVAKEESDKNNASLSISNPRGQVSKMFELSNFSSLFDIKQ